MPGLICSCTFMNYFRCKCQLRWSGEILSLPKPQKNTKNNNTATWWKDCCGFWLRCKFHQKLKTLDWLLRNKSPFYCEYSNIVLDTVQVKLRTDSIACKILSFHRKMKAPLKNKIWGVYNKQMLWLSFSVKVFGFSWTNEKIRFNSGEFFPLVEEVENYSPFCADSLLKHQNF